MNTLTPAGSQFFSHRLIKGLLLILALSAGLLLRTDTLHIWHLTPDNFFVNDEPLLSNLDGYYYLNIAKELQQTRYDPVDDKRAYPDKIQRSSWPPPLSLIVSTINKYSGISLNWISVFLPVVLGLTIGIPLYFYSSRSGSFLMVFGSIFMGVMTHYYAQRTSMGRLDTDCLNVTLALSCSYLFMRFGTCRTMKRHAFLGAGVLCYLFFLWWWDMSPAGATFLGLSPLVISLAIHYRPTGRERFYFYLAAFTTGALLFYFFHFQTISSLFLSAYQQAFYVFEKDTSMFPNIGLSISEQKKLLVDQYSVLGAANWSALLFSISGIIWLCIKKKSECLYLLPMTTVGIFSFFFARRFAILLTPVAALGFGFFFHQLYHFLKRPKSFSICFGLFIFLLTINSFMIGTITPSIYTGNTVAGMRKLSQVTQADSVIWSWWDEGHPIIYWADRATISDGYIHGGSRTYFNAIPLSTDNDRLAANFMRFYICHGRKGIQEFINSTSLNYSKGVDTLLNLLTGGPQKATQIIQRLNFRKNSHQKNLQQWLEFLFPPDHPPIYLFIDPRMMRVQRWIYWYGTWNIENHSGTKTLPTIKLDSIDFTSDQIPEDKAMTIDFDTGTVLSPLFSTQPILLSQVARITANKTEFFDFQKNQQTMVTPKFLNLLQIPLKKQQLITHEGQYILELFPEEKRVFLIDRKKANTVLHRLFRRKNDYDPQYFQPTDIDSPHYQIWKVKGDQLPTQHGK